MNFQNIKILPELFHDASVMPANGLRYHRWLVILASPSVSLNRASIGASVASIWYRSAVGAKAMGNRGTGTPKLVLGAALPFRRLS